MRRTMVHVGHEGLDRFGPPSRSKPYIICASMYSDCLDRDPLYPSFCSLRGGGRFYMEDQASTIVHDSDSISTCPIYKM
jgi:hypothetical protein